MKGLVFAAVCLSQASARGVLPVPSFEINLDLAPEDRFTEAVGHFRPVLQDLYKNIAGSAIVKSIGRKIAAARGPENDELMGEIRGMSKASGIPVEFIHFASMIYELQTFMVPLPNVTWPWGETTDTNLLLPKGSRDSLFGCTGIIARSEADGTVYHARNLDFSFAHYLGNMTYNGIFMKGGKELFTAQMIAGYSSALTGMRKGPNGYTIEINTRFEDTLHGNHEVITNLFHEKRNTSGWVKRKIMENIDNYEDAVKAMSESPYASTEYNIVSGVKKGVILARKPDGLAYKLELGDKRYIVMTNFDYIWHDVREWLDYTDLQGLGHSRRIGVETLLNKSKVITPELLYSVLNDKTVMAVDTIFQAIMNVQKGMYNTSLPDCKACDGCESESTCLAKAGTCCSNRMHYSLECNHLGGYKCGCLPDGACRVPSPFNETEGDADCCSSESHFSLTCGSRRCGKKPSVPEITVV